MKTCTKCHLEKDLSCFNLDGHGGLRGVCKICQKVSNAEYYLEHKAEAKVYGVNYRRKHMEEAKVYHKEWRLDNPWSVSYFSQKGSADVRGIEWDISLDEYIKWWGESFARRGCGSDDLVMARYGDRRGYSLDNIHMITASQNSRDRSVYARDEESLLSLVAVRRADECRRRIAADAEKRSAASRPLSPESKLLDLTRPEILLEHTGRFALN